MFENLSNQFANSNNLFEKILFWFFNTLTDIFTTIINFITTPIMSILRNLIPNFDSYFTQLNNFINNYIFKGFQFVKMSFINLLKIDHTIFTIVVILSIISIAIFFSTRALKLGLNLWSIKDNGKTKN